MALPTSYLITTKNLEAFFNSLITAQAPERFGQKFLQDLDFKSTNDRLFIGILKSLKIIDENSVPTERYYQFLDQTQSKQVLAEAIKEAYSDLFSVNVNAHTLNADEVKNKLRTLTQGQKSDKVLGLMASTFKALVEYADWNPQTKAQKKQQEVVKDTEKVTKPETVTEQKEIKKTVDTEFHYNIQIHLPITRDVSVYDALFKSLKDHLL